MQSHLLCLIAQKVAPDSTLHIAPRCKTKSTSQLENKENSVCLILDSKVNDPSVFGIVEARKQATLGAVSYIKSNGVIMFEIPRLI
jgi:hypothetical protein